MNRALFITALLFATLPIRADDAAAKLSNAKLPKCDKVEVLYLSPLGFEGNKPPEGADAYYTATGWWTAILGTKTLMGEDAETLAAFWRSLAHKPTPDGLTPMMFNCHSPGYAYRFYVGDKLAAESSVCWKCENFTIKADGTWTTRGFDPEASAANRLLARCKELFPKSQPK